jgi:hypothetical protein
VRITPFIAHTVDGLVVLSSAKESLTLINNQVNYLVCYAQYQATAQPIIQMRVITQLEWDTSVHRQYFITFAKFDLVTGQPHAFVDATHADYSQSDYSDKLGRNSWRLPGTTVSTLPVVQNRKGDTRVALDSLVTYTWTGTAWQAMKTLASVVTVVPTGNISATNVQAALVQLDNLFATAAYASNITITPVGNISSTNVQAALAELDTEKISTTAANTYTAEQTISAAGFDTNKLSVINQDLLVASHWAKLIRCQNGLNHLRMTLSGSGTSDPKRFEFTVNANYNSTGSQYSADNAGAAPGQEAGMLRLDVGSNMLSVGYKASTVSNWSEGSWVKTDISFPKTTSMFMTLLTDGTFATPTTLSDRVVNTSMALISRLYVSFPRRFVTAPASVTLSGAGALEYNVASASVSDITSKGFVLTITPTTTTTPSTPAVFTLDRTWTTS